MALEVLPEGLEQGAKLLIKRGDETVELVAEEGGDFVFRGTTEGYPGSVGTQQAGVTPTSSDPLVATCYAQNACATFGGDGVVQVIDPKIAESTYSGYLTQDFEIVLDGVNPSQAAANAVKTISVSDAIEALNQMGIDVPNSIGPEGLSTVLQQLQQGGTTPLSQEQIQQFLELTGSK